MSPRPLMAWPVPAVLLLAWFLPGQSAAVLGPRNARFLEGLWRAGYIEEAKRIGELVAASKLPDAEKKAVDTIYDRLKLAILIKEGDGKGRKEHVQKQIAEKKAEVDAAPANSEAQIDKLAELIDQYRLLADAMTAVLAQETDATAQATARKEVDQQFEAFEKELKDKAAATDKLRDENKPGTELPFLVSTYGLGRVYYYHALLFPPDDYGGKKLIEKSLAVLEDFDLEFGDSFAAFEAKLTTALCQARLGDVNTAIEVCNDAIALRTRFDKDKNGVYQVDRNAADVIAAAVLQKTLFLKDLKEHSKILDATKDYLHSIPKPLEAPQGPNVLAAQAEAQMELGDSEGASQSAQKLVELGGNAAARGQQLLSNLISNRGGSVGTDKMLSIATGLAQQGDFDGSLRMCRQILLQSKGPEGTKAASEALLITGAVFASRLWYQEASVAFDAVVRRYPKSEVAPDALWRSIQCFIELDDSEGLARHKRDLKDRSDQLVRDYPSHPHVGQLQLVEGRRMSKQGKFLEAAQVFERIAKESSAYLDARYYASSSYQGYARKLQDENKAAEAAQFTQKALEGFQAVMRDAESSKQSTTDAKVKARLEGIEYGARIAVANLLLSGTAKPAEAEAVIKPIDVKPDDKQYATIAALKVRILLAQGNIDQAADAMDIAIEKSGDQPDLLAACRTLATGLDDKAVERQKANDRRAAEALWRRASNYYLRSTNSRTVTNAEVTRIAERLRVIGMILNDVDPKLESWFEAPAFKPRVTEPWDYSLQLYQRLADNGAATYKTRIGRAWILGFLGRFDEAQAELTQVFAEKENKIKAGKRLDTNVLSKRPELLIPYLELGFALRAPRPGNGGDQKARLVNASEIFDQIAGSVKPDGKHWWYARYGLMHTLYDRGIYEDADVSMKSLERTNPEFDDNRFGLKQPLISLKAQIKLKNPK